MDCSDRSIPTRYPFKKPSTVSHHPSPKRRFKVAKAKLRLTLSIWDYDRTRALADGSVAPEGIDLNVLELPVEETFFRMARYREFDASEMSM